MPRPYLAVCLGDLRDRHPQRLALACAQAAATQGQEVDLVIGSRRGSLHPAWTCNLGTVDLHRRTAAGTAFTLARYLAERRPGLLIADTPSTGVIAVVAALLAGTATSVVAPALEPAPFRSLPFPSSLWRRASRRVVLVPYGAENGAALLALCLAAGGAER